jgi:hypothetical protein
MKQIEFSFSGLNGSEFLTHGPRACAALCDESGVGFAVHLQEKVLPKLQPAIPRPVQSRPFLQVCEFPHASIQQKCQQTSLVGSKMKLRKVGLSYA